MKNCNNRFQIESHSTQERERRFIRSKRMSSSRSHSNYSPSTSISKFFVKNMSSSQVAGVNDLLTTAHQRKESWSPPLRPPTPSHTNYEKKIKFNPEQLFKDRELELTKLKKENQHYSKYSRKQKETLQIKERQLKDAKDKLALLQEQNKQNQQENNQLRRKLDELEKQLTQKKSLIQVLKQNQSSLKKVKGSIFTIRMEEIEAEKQQLCQKISKLQSAMEKMKIQGSCMVNIEDEKWKNNLIESLKNSEEEIYKWKQENNKLLIELNFQKMKFYREMEAYKQSKQSQYFQLKKKFTEFLSKYNMTMKKMASYRVQSLLKEKKINKQQSLQSLSFSSVEEDRQ